MTAAPTRGGESEIAIAGYGIAKHFGHVAALSNATIEVHAGEVVALLGDNGAGKSTLVKTLLGILRPDAGKLVIRDEEVLPRSIRDAQAHGVDCVYQDLALAPDLSVIDNMFLGHEQLRPGLKRRVGLLDRGDMRARADAALGELGIELPSLTVDVSELSGGQRQAVAVARAVMWARTAVLMDEPTAALGARQSEIVCELMRTVARRGLGVLAISHDIPRILKAADRAVILWRGETVYDGDAAQLTVPEAIALMVGFDEGTP